MRTKGRTRRHDLKKRGRKTISRCREPQRITGEIYQVAAWPWLVEPVLLTQQNNVKYSSTSCRDKTSARSVGTAGTTASNSPRAKQRAEQKPYVEALCHSVETAMVGSNIAFQVISQPLVNTFVSLRQKPKLTLLLCPTLTHRGQSSKKRRKMHVTDRGRTLPRRRNARPTSRSEPTNFGSKPRRRDQVVTLSSAFCRYAPYDTSCIR